ncbi:MAG TPA: hypothetical protein VGP72_04305 [Planctomycetota bacterium]
MRKVLLSMLAVAFSVVVVGCGEAPPVKKEEKKPDAPKTDAPKTDAPKTDAPKTDAPKTETK